MNHLQEIVARMPNQSVMVVGDVMIDVYIFGRCARISQEAPVPVFIEERRDTRMGGAGNVENQLRALRVVGPHSWNDGVRTHKFRWFHGTQQVFRQDEDIITRPQSQEISLAACRIPRCRALVLSDYAKGWLSEDMCRALIEDARLSGVPVVVDPKGSDWSRYRGATVICPNDEEWRLINHASSVFDLPYSVLHKRADKGMRLFIEGENLPIDIDPRARHVYDVTGAGDTVTAVVAAALAAGAGLEDAARLATLAAGWVVGEVGTCACSYDTLMQLAGEA